MKIIGKITYQHIVILMSLIIPFGIVAGSIYHGKIAFWFDPARDLSLALENLSNLTFIGQPTGIPGIYYGPYWIWLISLALAITHDPRFVSLTVLTVPYLTIFPYLLYKISKKWGFFIFISLWLLFIINFSGYAIQIWNVNLAPLFIIAAVFFAINTEVALPKKSMLRIFLCGILSGAVLNFHMSLGIAISLGFSIYFLTLHFVEINKVNLLSLIKKMVFNTLTFFLGVLSTFIPFGLFELKHNFAQTRILIDALTNSLFYNSAVVGVTGMTDGEIVFSFFNRFAKLFGFPDSSITIILLMIIYLFFIVSYKKKIILDKSERRILILLSILSISILYIFISNKNPIWNYYFIGVEIIFLLFLGLVFSKLKSFKYFLLVPLSISFILNFDNLRSSFQKNTFENTDLGTEKYIVQKISDDANGKFYYYAYNPAILTYEYDYLFKWLNEDKLDQNSDLIYLIIPKIHHDENVDRERREEYIEFKTPSENYRRAKDWKIPDGTTLLRMEKK